MKSMVGDIKTRKELGRTGGEGRVPYILRACEGCGEEKWVELSVCRGEPRTKKCKSCSLRGRKKSAEHIKKMRIGYARCNFHGSNHPCWKGGRFSRKGYIFLWQPKGSEFYPMCDPKGYVQEHRLVMAKHLGRCLLTWEIVHHKGTKYPNGSIENRSDNRIENLQLIAYDSHLQITLLERRNRKLERLVIAMEAENALLKDVNRQHGRVK